MILFIGCVTSYEDVKTSRIKNKWIFIGLAYAFFIYTAIFIICRLNAGICPLMHNFDRWCINLLISIVVAYLIWHVKIWGAGDAKLFIVYAALIPLDRYSNIYFDYYFASLLLLINIFLPATAFLFLKSCIFFSINRSGLNNALKEALRIIIGKVNTSSLIKLIKLVLGFFVFFFILKMLRVKLAGMGLGENFLMAQNLLVLIMLLFFRKLYNVFNRNFRLLIVLFCILILAVIFLKIPYLFLWEIKSAFIWTMAVVLLFPLFNGVINLYADMAERKNASFAPWMFLGALLTWFL